MAEATQGVACAWCLHTAAAAPVVKLLVPGGALVEVTASGPEDGGSGYVRGCQRVEGRSPLVMDGAPRLPQQQMTPFVRRL